jgi:hypothetical protein
MRLNPFHPTHPALLAPCGSDVVDTGPETDVNSCCGAPKTRIARLSQTLSRTRHLTLLPREDPTPRFPPCTTHGSAVLVTNSSLDTLSTHAEHRSGSCRQLTYNDASLGQLALTNAVGRHAQFRHRLPPGDLPHLGRVRDERPVTLTSLLSAADDTANPTERKLPPADDGGHSIVPLVSDPRDSLIAHALPVMVLLTPQSVRVPVDDAAAATVRNHG